MKQKKDELMFKDENAIINTQKELADANVKLNNYLSQVREFLGEESEIDLSNLINLSSDDLLAVMRKSFPFPNSTDSFNFRALGKNTENIFSYHKNNAAKWKRFVFEFKDEKFVPSEDQPEISKHSYYANTDERKRVFDLVKKASEIVKELKRSKLYNANSPANNFGFDINGISAMQPEVFRMFLSRIDKGEFSL